MALIHLPSQQKDSFGKRFGNAFNPALQKGLEGYQEESGEKRKAAAKALLEEKKEQREQDRLKANTKALLGDEYEEGLALEPSTLSTVYKENQKNQRQQKIADIIQNSSGGPQNGEAKEKLGPGNQSQGLNLGNLSDQDILAIVTIDPQQGKLLQDAKANQQKNDFEKEKVLRNKFESDREFEWKRAGDILKSVDTLRDSMQEKRTAVNLIKNTAGSNDTSKWGDWFADVLGVEPLRSADAALLKSATKDFFINNLARAGNRPNQWIEQQINDAMVKIGRDPEANQKVAELMDYWVDREEEKVRMMDLLEDQDRAEYGYIRGDISKRAAQNMKNWEDKRRDLLSYKLAEMSEKAHPEDLEIISTVPKGTPLTIEKARVFKRRYGPDAEKAAKKAGYDLDIYARVAE